ncbi:Protein kinase-like domain containing protein [Tylopilus felleus]|jgi:serine/threonine protein kinase
MSVLSAVPYATALFLQSAQVTAQFTPVPWLAPAIGLVNTLITMIKQANANKHALHQLQDRCLSFLVIVQQTGDGAPAQEQQILVAGVEGTLRSMIDRMDKWCAKSAFELFIKQADLATAIQDCHMEINDSLTKLQVTAALETVAWQSEFEANNNRDRAEILRYLSDIKNTHSIIAMTQHQQSADIKAIMALMQQNLSVTPDGDTQGLGTNLYQIQKSTGKLLANMHLQRGEVRRLGPYPVSGTGSMDIWEGIYLSEEKVAIKILRAVHSTPKSLLRFKREVDIWNRVWETDQGRHILPLYGFCQNDGPFPYVVSPWHPHGTADKYVAQHRDVDHLALIRGISAGVYVLHTMNPPIVHGDLKGANIIIDSVGNPLLADFGFSRVVEDITGVPFTQSAGVSNSQRWLAPELCFDKGRLTMAADVYAFGMTMLELMTHAMPWATVRHTTQVIIKVAEGEKPPKPCDEATIARGFDDHLWDVMQKCWDDAEIRPTVTEVMQMLSVPVVVQV